MFPAVQLPSQLHCPSSVVGRAIGGPSGRTELKPHHTGQVGHREVLRKHRREEKFFHDPLL